MLTLRQSHNATTRRFAVDLGVKGPAIPRTDFSTWTDCDWQYTESTFKRGEGTVLFHKRMTRKSCEMTGARVLVVDDDVKFVRRATVSLGSLADIESIASGEDLLRYVRRWLPDVVVLSLLLDDRDGFQLLEELLSLDISPPPYVLCTTSGPASATRVSPSAEWPVGTISRTAQLHQLRDAVRSALESREELITAVH
jgi:CheY-like chemotaxis protein